MRDLALHVAATGHDVTYVTMRHWDASERPSLAGVRVLGLTPAGRVYRRERRTLLPPLRFGLAVAGHLWRHGSEYDIVHMASFPYFPLLAASAIGRRRKYALVVNWLEIWTQDYWRRYAGDADRDDRLARAAGLRRSCRTRPIASRGCMRERLVRRRLLRDAGAPAGPLRRAGRPERRSLAVDPDARRLRRAPRSGEARRPARARVRARTRAATRPSPRALRRRA